LLFAACDIIAGYIIYQYCMIKNAGNRRQAIICANVWLFNPLTVTVSTRGNAESVMAVLVLFALLLLAQNGSAGIVLGAVMYGLSVHMKIYPVTYALALYLHINECCATNRSDKVGDSWSSWCSQLRCIWPTSMGVMFALVSLSTFLLTTVVCYSWLVVLHTYCTPSVTVHCVIDCWLYYMTLLQITVYAVAFLCVCLLYSCIMSKQLLMHYSEPCRAIIIILSYLMLQYVGYESNFPVNEVSDVLCLKKKL